jgi:hypothetical protein
VLGRLALPRFLAATLLVSLPRLRSPPPSLVVDRLETPLVDRDVAGHWHLTALVSRIRLLSLLRYAEKFAQDFGLAPSVLRFAVPA